MTTQKKNQHYIPKFYLRNFSYQDNKKQIGAYSIKNELYVQQAKLKTQGSKNFFYGYDGIIENELSNIEDKLALVIKNIVSNKILPKKNSSAHFELLLFVALTDFRNPVKIDGMKQSLDEMRRRLIELHPATDVDKLIPRPTHDELVKLHISSASQIGLLLLDLDYKLLINRTSKPFITSDFPIVKYNQFLENKKWPFSKTGYGLTGLQIFIPLNHEVVLMLFDQNIYKLGDRKKSFHTITNEKNVDDINKLQFLNCLETIFFDEKADASYVKSLHNQAKKYKRANITRSELNYLIRENVEKNKRAIDAGFKNFMMINKSDCETQLKIDKLNIHSKGKTYKINNSLAQLRPHAKRLRDINDLFSSPNRKV